MIDNAQTPVLLVVDLQMAIDHPDWGSQRNNPDAEATVDGLLSAWRAAGRAHHIVHVRHDSTQPGSHYRPGTPTHAFKPEAQPVEGEFVLSKSVNSAFVGTDLTQRLQQLGCDALLVCGVITNNSVEATVRSAGNLGFNTFLLEDACFTFAKTDWNGVQRSAEEVHAMSLANLHGEYCQVLESAKVLADLKPL